jgi:hypothetical protein
MVRQALGHLAQNLWTHETNDKEFLSDFAKLAPVDELRRWIRFQRAYLLFQTQGVPENELHRRACEASYEESSSQA